MIPRRLRLFAIGFVAGLFVVIIIISFISYASYYPTSPSELLAVTRASINPHPVKTVIEHKTQSLSIIDAYYEDRVTLRPDVYPDGELRYRTHKIYTVTILNNSDVPIESIFVSHYKNSYSYGESYNSEFGAHQKKTIQFGMSEFEDRPTLACVVFQNGAFEGDTNHSQLNLENLAEARKAFLLIKQNLDSLLITYPNNSQKVIDELNDSVNIKHEQDLLLHLGRKPPPDTGYRLSAFKDGGDSQIMGENHAYFILNQFLQKNPLASPDRRLGAIKNELSKFVNKLKN